MPIYDYACRTCGNRFEALVRGGEKTRCTQCQGEDLEQLLTLPAVQSESTRGLAMKAARKRDAAQGKDRMHEQLRYEQTHDRHG